MNCSIVDNTSLRTSTNAECIGVDMIRIRVNCLDANPSHRTHNFTFIGAPTLTEEFTTAKIPTYDPGEHDYPLIPSVLQTLEGHDFTFPRPPDEKFFFRAAAELVP